MPEQRSRRILAHGDESTNRGRKGLDDAATQRPASHPLWRYAEGHGAIDTQRPASHPLWRYAEGHFGGRLPSPRSPEGHALPLWRYRPPPLVIPLRLTLHPVGSWSRTQDTGRGLGAQDVDSSGACQPLSISRLVPFQFDYLLSSQMASLRFHGPATIQLSSICSVCFCAWPSCADDGDESVGLGPCRLFLSLPCTCRLYRLHIRCARPVYLLRPDSALLSPQSKPFLSTVKTTT
jgi:hypothetical protein